MKLKFILLVLIYTSSSFTTKTSKSLFPTEQVSLIIMFQKHSIELLKGEYEVLDEVAILFNEENSTQKTKIILKIRLCQEEKEKDKFLGIKRAKIVRDYLILEKNINPNYVLILDYDTYDYFPKKGCEDEGIRIHFVKG